MATTSLDLTEALVTWLRELLPASVQIELEYDAEIMDEDGNAIGCAWIDEDADVTLCCYDNHNFPSEHDAIISLSHPSCLQLCVDRILSWPNLAESTRQMILAQLAAELQLAFPNAAVSVGGGQTPHPWVLITGNTRSHLVFSFHQGSMLTDGYLCLDLSDPTADPIAWAIDRCNIERDIAS